MPTENLVSPRVPWKAALLGVATTGLGQLYSGRTFRAIIVYLLSIGFTFIAISAFFLPAKPWNIITPVIGLLLWWILVLGDAAWCAKRAAPEYRLKAYNRWYIYLLIVVMAGGTNQGLINLIKARSAEGFQVTGGSMLPTLSNGDRFFVHKRAYVGRAPQRGDIVALRYPRNPSFGFVERVVAVGGDIVRIVDKKVYVNGVGLDEPYVQYRFFTELPLRDDFPPPVNLLQALPAAWGLDPAWAREMPGFIHPDGLHVPKGYLFCLGDNRDKSLDSRFWGFVPLSDIVGRAEVVYFSWDAKAHRVRWDRVGEILK